MKLGIRIALSAALALAIVATAKLALADTTPPSLIQYGPGQSVKLTGAQPATTAAGAVVLDTVATKTAGNLLDVNNGGTTKASIDYNGVLTVTGLVDTGATNTITSATTNGAAFSVVANALTTGQAISVPHTTSVIADGGALVKLSSTSVDTATTTGSVLNAAASGSVAATVVNIAASNAAQTTETGLAVTQSGTTASYTGSFVNFTCSSTTGSGKCVSITGAETTDGSAESITAAAATTSTAGILAVSGTALTSGKGVLVTGGGANMLTGGIVADVEMGAATLGSGVKIVTSGAYTDTAAAPLWVSAPNATTTTFGLVRVDGAALTSGSAMVIKGGTEAAVTTAGRYLSVQDNAGAEQFSVGVDGHQVFAQTSAPIVTNTGGSGPSCSGCTDTNGKIVATTAANTNVITLTFHTSATPRGCIITPADANTAADLKAAGGGVVAVSAGAFTVSSPSANWAANQKNIYYSCFF